MLSFNLIMVDSYAALGWGRSFSSVAWPTGVQLVFFVCSGFHLVIRRSFDFVRKKS